MFKKILTLAGLILASSACTSVANRTQSASETPAAPEDRAAYLKNFKPQQVTVRPGFVTLMKVPYVGLENPKLICRGETTPFYIEQGQLKAYLAESYFSPFQPYQCEIQFLGGKLVVANVKVEKYRYKQEKLNVDQKRVVLSKKDLDRSAQEAKVLEAVYTQSSPEPYFTGAFVSPMDSFVTSIYGTKRVFNNKKKTQHLGTDFRAAVGVPVPVSNRGRVVYVGDLFFSGGTVIVDHGLGIFTMYGHLSEMKVKVGDMVDQGQIVALSGATGRVSGPHLHWGVKVAQHWVDGPSLVSAGR